MRARDVISVSFFMILLLYGPLYEWSGGSVVRIGYLILLPYALWFLLGWLWDVLYINNDIDKIVVQVTFILIALFFIFHAYLFFISKSHIGNTMWVRSPEGGHEAVGDDISVQGPDYASAYICLGLGIISVIAAGFSKRKTKN